MARTTTLDRQVLANVLRKQHGVIARRQTIACGMSDRALRHRIRPAGPWQRLLPATYLAQTGVPTADQRDMAALLYAGAGSVITGYAALQRLGLRVPQATVIDVLVPASRQPQSTGFVRVHRSGRMPDQFCVSGGIRFAMAARAVADAARSLRRIRDARDLVAGSVQAGWCGLAELAGELARGPSAGSALFRSVLAEVADGIRSVAEGDLRDLINDAGLPVPVFNARLYAGGRLIAIADAWWPDARVAAEVDSREWHLSPADWERTIQRHARLTAEGILVLHFTPRQIRTERAQVVATLRAAIAAGRGAPGPPMRALPPSA